MCHSPALCFYTIALQIPRASFEPWWVSSAQSIHTEWRVAWKCWATLPPTFRHWNCLRHGSLWRHPAWEVQKEPGRRAVHHIVSCFVDDVDDEFLDVGRHFRWSIVFPLCIGCLWWVVPVVCSRFLVVLIMISPSMSSSFDPFERVAGIAGGFADVQQPVSIPLLIKRKLGPGQAVRLGNKCTHDHFVWKTKDD